jgi:hypothetical protein
LIKELAAYFQRGRCNLFLVASPAHWEGKANSSGTFSHRWLTGFNAQDRVQRAPANEAGSERDEPDPAPHRLICWPEKANSSGDEREADEDAQDAIDSSGICSHDIISSVCRVAMSITPRR